MDMFVRPARRGAVVMAAVLSMTGGMLLAWNLVRPAALAGASTLELLIVIGLLVLPVAAIGAWQADRVATAESPAVRAGEDD